MNPFLCKRCRREHIGECADVAELIRQRDELLEALESVMSLDILDDEQVRVVQSVRAAIAKAKQ